MSQRSSVQPSIDLRSERDATIVQEMDAWASSASCALISTLAGDCDLAELVRDFAAGLPAKAAQLDRLRASNDQAGLSNLVHQLRGAGGGYGYPAIAAAAAQLEKIIAEEADPQKIDSQIAGLQKLCIAAAQGAEQTTQSDQLAICSVQSKLQCDAPENGLSLLLVDDDPSVLELMDGILRPLNVAIRFAQTGSAALDSLSRQPPDIVLLDYNIPLIDGLSVLKRIRSDARFKAVEIIFSTIHAEDDLITACFSAGANDYIRKPFNRTELLARVRAAISRRQTEQLLRSVARIDYLTGAPNRLALVEQTAHLVARAKNFNQPFAVLFLDCDRFRTINDALGHQGGDELLTQICSRLQQCVSHELPSNGHSEPAMVCRFGGDQFVVLLPNVVNTDQAQLLAQSVMATLEQPFSTQGQLVQTSVCAGLIFGDRTTTSPSDLLRDAGIALQEAKSQGKGHLVTFDQSQLNGVRQRHELEADLAVAVQQEQLVLHYQPIVDLSSGQARGLEALVRWNHPRRGMISPEQFISIAEETGVILPLGRRVIKDACRDMRRILDDASAIDLKYMSVNLSRAQLFDPQLIDAIRQGLRRYQLHPSQLMLEVTESQMMADTEQAVRQINELRNAGIRIALDDFGTGHSSLACLERLPIDVLKIDRSFVADIVSDAATSGTLIYVALYLAERFQLECVAEGIETQQQLQRLQDLGCPAGQGYFFSRPLPLSDLIDHLRKQAQGSRVRTPATLLQN